MQYHNLVETYEQLEKTNYTYRVAAVVQRITDRNLAYQKRREIPLWIVLTTQAAGLTDLCAGFWFDDEMSLTNITTNFTVEGRTLEEQASTLQRQHQGILIRISRRVIR